MSGIFNPYATAPIVEEKKNFEYVNLHDKEENKPAIRLDGDSYVLVLDKTTLEEVPGRLAKLINDIDEYDRKMRRISITKENVNTDPCVLTLPVPNGYLNVYVGEGGTEVEAFRRIGQLCYGFNHVLKRHNAKVIVR